jgi:hypothetical protein
LQASSKRLFDTQRHDTYIPMQDFGRHLVNGVRLYTDQNWNKIRLSLDVLYSLTNVSVRRSSALANSLMICRQCSGLACIAMAMEGISLSETVWVQRKP